MLLTMKSECEIRSAIPGFPPCCATSLYTMAITNTTETVICNALQCLHQQHSSTSLITIPEAVLFYSNAVPPPHHLITGLHAGEKL